jgi:hypothetical protein
MRITVYKCTQDKLVGYHFDASYEQLGQFLDEKRGVLCKEIEQGECIDKYAFKFDWIEKIGLRRFIIRNSNMSIWCKSNIPIPDYAFGDRSFVIRKYK